MEKRELVVFYLGIALPFYWHFLRRLLLLFIIRKYYMNGLRLRY
jgi:hypothetical protein